MKNTDRPNGGQKFWWELKDILTGAAFPLIVMLVLATTISLFAAFDDITVQVFALGGGDIMLFAAYFMFGKQNGLTAYRKYILNEKKRALESSDLKSIYRTGEYSLWKGFVIPAVTCVPYIIIQIIHLCAPNIVTDFLLQYACGWAYFPFKIAGLHEALGFIFIILPVAFHAGGYYYGMTKERKAQEILESASADSKNGKK